MPSIKNMRSRVRERHEKHGISRGVPPEFFTFFDSMSTTGSHVVRVDIVFHYSKGREPIRVDVKEYIEEYGSTEREHDKYFLSVIKIHVYLDIDYDRMVNGEPIVHHDYLERYGELSLISYAIDIAGFTIDKIKDSLVAISHFNAYKLLKLYLLERRYNIVTLIIDVLERKKEEKRSERERKDYDSVIRFLRWLRDTVFPVLDQTIDLSYVRNTRQLIEGLKDEDIYSILSVIDFLNQYILNYLFYA